MDPSRYFDHAATTPLDPRVLEAMMPWLKEGFGNPHSLHSFGTAAHAAVERAREQVALAVGAEDPSAVTFTSGATEAVNTVLRAYDQGIVSPFEHSAVRETAALFGAETMGWDGQRLTGSEGHDLVSLMQVCNESGRTFRPKEGYEFGVHVLSDMTQALGKLPVDASSVDYAAFSAHKIFGPKGVGALVRNPYESYKPLLTGGGQENGLRSGTLNVPAIVGFGVAAELAIEEMEARRVHAEQLRAVVQEGLLGLSDICANGGKEAVPHILSLSFLDLEGETMVLEADAGGFAISAGAACSAGSTDPSPAILAEGRGSEWARGTVRIAFGPSNTVDSAHDLAKILRRTAQSLRTMRKVA